MLNTKDILGRLKNLREEKAIRQESIARRLGIARTTYVRKERGAIPITTDEWLKLACAMKEEPSYFFSASSAAMGLKKKYSNGREKLLLKLYRSLDGAEKDEFICTLSLALKDARKKTVRQTLGRLIKT
ncbi:MAG: helix-turn-helix transcriptional regulator [Deltaproteobacteria bacterium]|nr:helix-turn-helix transcriptional regulator [Deltaproteobacteria bacterium]